MPFLSKGKIKTAFTVQFCFNSTNKWDAWEETVSQAYPSLFKYSIGNQIFQVFKLQLDVLNYKTVRPIAQWNMKTSGGLNLWLLKVLK